MNRTTASMHALLAGVSAVMLVAPVAPAFAQQRTQKFDIPSQAAAPALNEWARQASTQIVFPYDAVEGKRAQAVRGVFTPGAALEKLIAPLGLRVTSQNAAGTTLAKNEALRSGEAHAGSAAAVDESAEILVTGSRIKGVDSASPTTKVTAEQIRQEGRTDLGMVARNLSENYNGGQNPGVVAGGGGPNSANQNIGGGAAFNLRGLGPDATLTLLNGRRLTYSGFSNAIDISAIPIVAVERVEVVTDGASAIYGSDAVAGVANVILRRDYDGVAATLRGGTTTRGGGSEYQFSLTGGKTWQNGGFLLSYDRGQSDPILARQRDFIVGMADPTYLLEQAQHDSVLFSGHQALGPVITMNLDAFYNARTTANLARKGAYLYDSGAEVRSFLLSPAIDIDLSGGWSGRISGIYGEDENRYRSIITDAVAGTVLANSRGCYCNTTHMAEFGLEGPLIELPGGPLRIAAGGGYRYNSFYIRPDSSNARGGSTSSSFAYGELNVPLVSPAMNVGGINRLNLSGALRYEKYRLIGGELTPKVGIVYEPTPDFSLKGSWGRSFKAASLTQQFQKGYGELAPANVFGNPIYPASADGLFVVRPSADLRPEHAETWTATLGIHPERIAGLNLQLSYFNVDYTDRVVSPIGNIFAALRDPAYAPFVILSPTRAQISAALAAAGTEFVNDTGGDPYASVAIVDNTLTNSASDKVSGFDLSGSYRFTLAGGSAELRGSGSWLMGTRQLLKNGPTQDTVGIVFNPPTFRGRAGVSWEKNGFGVATFFNHVGSVFANYFAVQQIDTGSFDTVDVNLRYAVTDGHGPLSDLELALTIDNAFDAAPPLFSSSVVGRPNFDSTNYSAIGRKISVSVTKKW